MSHPARAPDFPIALLACFLAAQALSTDLYLPALPAMMTGLATTQAVVQLSLTLYIAVFAVLQLFAGPLSDRYGRYPLLMGGLVVFALGSIGCALAPSVPLMLTGRAFQAMGSCAVVVAARATVRDCHGREASAHRMSTAGSWTTSASLAGPIVGGYLVSHGGWRANFWALMIYALLTLWFAKRALHETNLRPLERLNWRVLGVTYWRIAQNATFRAYALCALCAFGGIIAFLAGSSFVIIKQQAWSPEAYAYGMSTSVLGYLLGTWVCRRLLGRYGSVHTLRVGANISAAGGLILAACAVIGWQTPWHIFVGYAVFLIGYGIASSCIQAGAAAPFGASAGSAAALLGFVQMGSASLIGQWIGAAENGTAYPMTLTIFVSSALMCFVAWRVVKVTD